MSETKVSEKQHTAIRTWEGRSDTRHVIPGVYTTMVKGTATTGMGAREEGTVTESETDKTLKVFHLTLRDE